MKYSLSVIIPVFNGVGSLEELLTRIQTALGPICEELEIILVNDGSRDKSWQLIQDLRKTIPSIRAINLMRNYGQHNALLCGVRYAKNEIIVTMDDDLQHPPEEIAKLLAKLDQGYDVVYGIPNSLVHSNWRNFSSKLTKKTFARFLGIKNIQYISAFRAFRTDLRKAFDQFESPDVILDALLVWGTENFGIVEVNENKRKVGRSNYNFFQLVKFAMVILTGFSTIPLRLSSITGFLLTLFGIGVLIYVVYRSFQEGSVPGFPFLASIISIFSGAQLFTLGIFGEYLARIFNQSMSHPTYIVDRIIE